MGHHVHLGPGDHESCIGTRPTHMHTHTYTFISLYTYIHMYAFKHPSVVLPHTVGIACQVFFLQGPIHPSTQTNASSLRHTLVRQETTALLDPHAATNEQQYGQAARPGQGMKSSLDKIPCGILKCNHPSSSSSLPFIPWSSSWFNNRHRV